MDILLFLLNLLGGALVFVWEILRVVSVALPPILLVILILAPSFGEFYEDRDIPRWLRIPLLAFVCFTIIWCDVRDHEALFGVDLRGLPFVSFGGDYPSIETFWLGLSFPFGYDFGAAGAAFLELAQDSNYLLVSGTLLAALAWFCARVRRLSGMRAVRVVLFKLVLISLAAPLLAMNALYGGYIAMTIGTWVAIAAAVIAALAVFGSVLPDRVVRVRIVK